MRDNFILIATPELDLEPSVIVRLNVRHIVSIVQIGHTNDRTLETLVLTTPGTVYHTLEDAAEVESKIERATRKGI